MSISIAEKIQKIKALEHEIESELEKRRKEFHYRVDRGRIVFEADIQRRQRALRVPLGRFLARTRPLFVLTAPFIYAVIIGFIALDILASLYQAICFPVYGIRKVCRKDYIILDRQYLGYLNGMQKLNCLYCGYGNGLLAYVGEIASRTEQYWCPIKHARHAKGTHARYALFLEYGDGEDFETGLEKLRKKLNDEARSGEK